MSKSSAPTSTPTPAKGEVKSKSKDPRSIFVSSVIDMSWRLALVVLVPVIAGAELDKALGTKFLTFVGLAVALVGSIAVMWRTMQTANRIPVPKLTAAQKRAIKKSYEEEDD